MATSSCVLQTGQNDMRTKHSLLQIYPTEVLQYCSFRFLLWCLLAFKALYGKGHQTGLGKGKFKGVTFVLAFFHLFSPLRNSESPPPLPTHILFPLACLIYGRNFWYPFSPPCGASGKKPCGERKREKLHAVFPSLFYAIVLYTYARFPHHFCEQRIFGQFLSLIFLKKQVTLPSMHIVYDMSVCTQL